MKSHRSSVLLLALLTCACGSGRDPPEVDVTGTWVGTDTDRPSTGILMTLQQSAGRVDGTYRVNDSPWGALLWHITGSVERRTFSFTINRYMPKCIGEVTGVADVEGASTPQRLSGSYSGRESCVSLGASYDVAASVTFEKQ